METTLNYFLKCWKSLVVLFLIFSVQPLQAQELPPAFECSTDGLLLQYPAGTVPPTNIQSINMVTGEDIVTASVTDARVNAAGYNVIDNYIYGWGFDWGQIVRVGADGSVEPVTITGGTLSAGVTGDVDENGHYWITTSIPTSSGNTWTQIDLTTNTVVASGPVQGGNINHTSTRGGADWAYVPGTNSLYRVATVDGGDSPFRLYRFDRDTKQHINEGDITGGGINVAQDGGWFGAVYADSEGFLYASHNDSGNIYRINVSNSQATLFAEGPMSNSNDGARCPIPVYTDYGDAPNSYSTLLNNDGPRHGLKDYDPGTNTTSLMLGTNVSHETDATPGANADGDSDDAVFSPINITVGQPSTVTVEVTNNTEEPATLAGWIDQNQSPSDNIFGSGTERSFITIPANSGTANYDLNFPAPVNSNDTYARFRLFPGEVSNPSPSGSAGAGEVEDYPVTINELTIQLNGGPCWRMLSSPIDGLTYAQMLDGLWTQGVPGADYDQGDPNLFVWDNTVSGNTGGWMTPSSLNEVISPGTGFLVSVFADDDYDGTPDPFPKTIGLSGPTHTGDVSPSMNSTTGGWTLVGNPYGQPVDFSELTTTNLTDVGYIYDRETGNWVSTTSDEYGDITDGLIATGQGFFVQNSGAAGSLTFTEDSRTTGGEFYGKQDNDTKKLTDYLRLELNGPSVTNSAWIRFSKEGSVEPAYGDATELQPLAEQYALFGSRKADGTLSDIGHFPMPTDDLEIPVHVDATQPGSYTITATDLDLPAGTDLYLHDLETGESVPVTEPFDYSFTIGQKTKSAPDSDGIVPCSATPQKAQTTVGDRFVITTSMTGPSDELPDEVALGQNYPNPFNPATVISYQLPVSSDVRLEVFDMIGRQVATLVDGTVEAGIHQVSFRANHLTSGVYLYRLTAISANGGRLVFTKKLTLIK